jgi:hypothetical protein
MDNNVAHDTVFSAEYRPPLGGTKHQHIFNLEYRNAQGELEWTEEIRNLVPNVALNNFLDTFYGATAKATAFYIGLVNGPGASNTYAAGDTMSAHAGWTESVPYSDSTRPVSTFGSAAGQAISNSSTPASFTINATATLAGCFLATVNTKSGTTGILVGVGNFSGGDRAVASGGTLSVTVTATASAS